MDTRHKAKDNQPTVHNPREARTLFQKQMEADAVIHNYPLGQAPRVPLKRGRSDNLSKAVKIMMGKLTGSADRS